MTIFCYTIFYEGNSVSAAELALGFGSLRPLPPAVGQILDSFQLIAAPEVAQALAQQASEAAEPAEGVDDDGDEDGGDDDGDEDGGDDDGDEDGGDDDGDEDGGDDDGDEDGGDDDGDEDGGDDDGDEDT